MKKFKLVLLTVVLGILLCACGEKEEYKLSDLNVAILQQSYGLEEVDIQEWRAYRAGTITASYAIDTLENLVEDPTYLGVHYKDLTYSEVEDFVLDEGFAVDGYAFVNAVTNFEKGIAETGSIVSVGDPVIRVDGNEIIVDVECVCANRNATAELIYKNDLTDTVLVSAAFNPDYNLGEKMSKAGLNTLIGMGTVFAMLIIIAFIIWLFGAVPALFKGTKKKDKTEEGINKAVEQIVKNETAESSDAELVAVIAAAVAAYEGTTDTSGFVVRSIRKIKRQ